jgi:hypothetical protein
VIDSRTLRAIQGRPWFRFQGHLFYLRPLLAICTWTLLCVSIRDSLPFANGIARALFFGVPVWMLCNCCSDEEQSARSRLIGPDGKRRFNLRFLCLVWFVGFIAASLALIANWMSGGGS